MTRAGKRYHQKRPSAPTTWPIHRKGSVWVAKISAGPHSKENGMPLLILLRDVLGVGQNRKEVQRILAQHDVLVDGRVRTSDRFPVGHMDVVEIPKEQKIYRVQLHRSDRLVPYEIPESEKGEKICKVIGKRNVRGGMTQISLHDGRNVLLEKDSSLIDEIKGQCSVKISIPEQEILDVYQLDEGSRALVTEGRHRGKIGKIVEISRQYGPKASEVILADEDNNEEFRTALDYVFVVSPEITLKR